MPEILYDTQEAVPEPFRANATAKDGKFAINVVPKSELDSFRENNLNTSKERDSLSSVIARLKTDVPDFDPEALDDFVTTYADLRSTKQLVEDGKLVKDTSLTEAVDRKTTEMRKAHESQINALNTSVKNLQTENSQLKDAVDNNVIVNEVTAAATDERSGIRGDAIRSVIREAKDFFKVKEGKLVPLDHEGNIVYGTDGTSPMTPMEWIKTRLSESSPFLFKESEGGGAQGGNGLGGLSPAQLAAMSPAERMRLARSGKA